MKMDRVERIGVSLDKELLSVFDKFIADRGYQSRSEAIRDLVRQQISQQQLEDPNVDAVATVCVVYDHHASNLMKKLTALQHSHLLQVISSTHIHLGHHDCMEMIVLKGRVGQIKKVADSIISPKGVKLGKVNFFPLS
jgi:CopG family transcriptional regulator, nickel-responsive regulator